jgi:TRAP-type C4-dicarboxylate transport system permease small subunit
MADAYRLAMDWLERIILAGCVLAIACMTTLIFIGVVMRYGFSLGAQFAEPMAIYFAIQLTFYGAAACYRAGTHLKLEFIVASMPPRLRWLSLHGVHALMAGIAIFMIVYGVSLVDTTWLQAYPEFESIRVGWVYTAIPGGGVALLLFVLESEFLPPPSKEHLVEEFHASH